jgi:hypothetical protein
MPSDNTSDVPSEGIAAELISRLELFDHEISAARSEMLKSIPPGG